MFYFFRLLTSPTFSPTQERGYWRTVILELVGGMALKFGQAGLNVFIYCPPRSSFVVLVLRRVGRKPPFRPPAARPGFDHRPAPSRPYVLVTIRRRAVVPPGIGRARKGGTPLWGRVRAHIGPFAQRRFQAFPQPDAVGSAVRTPSPVAQKEAPAAS